MKTLKKYLTVSLVAVLSSAMTLGAYLWYDGEKDGRTFKIEHVEKPIAQGAALTMYGDGSIVPLDFKTPANAAMKSVVHIKSTQTSQDGFTQQQPQQQLPHPFRDFFGNSPFGPKFEFRSPRSRGPQLRTGSGSGVIINSDGYIVTNNHVINMADDIEVTLHDNRNFKATVIGTDPTTDLALLQIRANDLQPLSMVNSDRVEVGEWVMAVGNPFNLNSTVTAGIVSAKGRNINILKDKGAIESFIQTDAAINPGNSGGALVDLNGNLVGINTAIASPTGSYSGYGFAVPSNIVSKVIEDLMSYGFVQRGYLGVMIRGVDGNLTKEHDLEVTSGVYVDSLLENSAAAKAGIEVGDVITMIDGASVATAPALQEFIGRKRPGDTVEITVDRQGKEKEFRVTLHNSDGNAAMMEKNSSEMVLTLGATFEEVEKEMAKKLDIDGGVKVKDIRPGKLKKQTDMREGFIITKVDGKKVDSIDELEELLEDKDRGVLLEGIYEDLPGRYYYGLGL